MNPKEGNKSVNALEATDIAPGETWFDTIGIRFFVNSTKNHIQLGFGHNARAIEVIIILNPDTRKTKSADTEVLEGEIVEENI